MNKSPAIAQSPSVVVLALCALLLGLESAYGQAFNATLDGHELVVEGTSGPDSIVVWEKDGKIGVARNDAVGGAVPIYRPEFKRHDNEIDARAPHRVTINCGEGDDEVYLGSARIDTDFGLAPIRFSHWGPIQKPAKIIGGPGRDRLAGSDADDWIEAGDGDDFVYGGKGNDRVFGGAGNDVIFGAEGEDRLNGEGDNDFVFGGPGADEVGGSDGNDGLFGGIGQADLLTGGAGMDRFLVFEAEDRIADPQEREDVGIVLSNGSYADTAMAYEAGTWTESEVFQIDRGLAYLHAKGGYRLLDFGAHIPGLRGLRLVRLGSQTLGDPDIGGFNQLDNKNTTIYIAATGVDACTIIHEVAHCVDGPAAGPFINEFRRISDWRQQAGHNNQPTERYGETWWRDADPKMFARNYGMVHPREDWATTWEAAYCRDAAQTQRCNLVAQKLDVVDRYFRSMLNKRP